MANNIPYRGLSRCLSAINGISDSRRNPSVVCVVDLDVIDRELSVSMYSTTDIIGGWAADNRRYVTVGHYYRYSHNKRARISERVHELLVAYYGGEDYAAEPTADDIRRRWERLQDWLIDSACAAYGLSMYDIDFYGFPSTQI